MPWDLTDDKSTLVQVMAWCRQAPSHYLSQCWPSSMSPYGVTRPQWVKCSLTSEPHWTLGRLASATWSPIYRNTSGGSPALANTGPPRPSHPARFQSLSHCRHSSPQIPLKMEKKNQHVFKFSLFCFVLFWCIQIQFKFKIFIASTASCPSKVGLLWHDVDT